jgi:nicotinate dehydrogenase subunit A
LRKSRQAVRCAILLAFFALVQNLFREHRKIGLCENARHAQGVAVQLRRSPLQDIYRSPRGSLPQTRYRETEKSSPVQPGTEGGMRMAIALSVNGTARQVEAPSGTTLLEVLRNHLGLMGTRYGCGLEQCGCCMVLVDGQPVYSCTREVGTVADRAIMTVEGLGTPAQPHALQRAFLDEQAGQCGYCLSGILISAKALIDRNANPSRADIVAALDKNLCRCGAHQRIIRAVERAAAKLRNGRPA